MALKQITKYSWSSDYALYNTKINNGLWSESVEVDSETGEEKTYYTMCTYKVISREGNTITYAGLKCNDLAQYLVEKLNTGSYSLDDLTTSTCAAFGCITSDEIAECRVAIEDFLSSDEAGTLIVKNYVTVEYAESLALAAGKIIEESENQLIADGDSLSAGLSYDDFGLMATSADDGDGLMARASVMSLSATDDSNSTDDTTTGDTEAGDLEVEVDYDSLINGTSKDPVSDILNLKIRRYSGEDWAGEKEYINYQYKFSLTIGMGAFNPIKGIVAKTGSDGSVYTPKISTANKNSESLWGYALGNDYGLWSIKQFTLKAHNRDTLYDLMVETFVEELDSGEVSLDELLAEATKTYNLIVVWGKVKKALLIDA